MRAMASSRVAGQWLSVQYFPRERWHATLAVRTASSSGRGAAGGGLGRLDGAGASALTSVRGGRGARSSRLDGAAAGAQPKRTVLVRAQGRPSCMCGGQRGAGLGSGNGKACCANNECATPLSCGCGGETGVCGCTPSCAGKACGADDGCNGVCTGGTCPGSGQHCENGVCACDETSCMGCCSGTTCNVGTADNACGNGGVTCTTCPSGQTCGTTCGVCGGSGQPCCSGNTCTSPLSCGAQQPGVCGSGATGNCVLDTSTVGNCALQ